jgi:glycosyltransferase involved in cell wall biosynthesis
MQDSLPAHGIQLVNTPEEADLIGTHIQIPGGWEKRFADKPIIAHCHGLYWEEFEWPAWAHEANHQVLGAIKTADRSTVPTDWVATAVRRHTGRNCAIIPHGIDAENWNADRPSLGYVYWDKTRPDPVCDPTHVNEVAKLVPTIPFVSTFGEPAENVRITGKVPFAEAKEAMEQAGVYLCTARETFGVSILQAFAAGVPVVGWRWGGAQELVEEGVTGFLARPYDWEGLAECIRRALEEGPSMRANLQAAAAKFTWDRAAEMYADLYREAWAEKNAKPKVTVLVTAYKLDKYLRDTLDSVQNQVLQEWECIIVDDNSPDNCGRIADEYAARDPRFRVIHNEKNMYLAGARNVGLAAARGKYIMSLDADDMLPPHATRILSEALDQDPKIHVAYGAVYFVGEDGNEPQVYGAKWSPGHSGWPIDFAWELQLRGDVVDADGNRHSAPNCLPYSSMIRTRAAREMGGWRERCRTAEDADFWARLSSYGYNPKRVTDADCLIYRVRTDSMSQTNARVDHTLWFGWRRANVSAAPAGVDMGLRPRVPSLEPPGISVIIPVGPGHERLVQTAVDSLEAQSWRGWEAIVVNDTGEELPPILPSWVRVFDTGGRKGVAHARNQGVRHSRGRILFFLDADDFLQPDALETFYRVYADEMEFDTVYYSDFFEDVHGENEWTLYECPNWDPNRLISNGMIGAVSMLIPRHIFQRVGGFDETIKGWEDWNLQIALADAGVCSRRIAAPLWNYRKRTGQRREENMADFEGSKNDILERWSDYYEGKRSLAMACSSCRKPNSSTVQGTQQKINQAQAKNDEALAAGLVAVIYEGPRDALHSYVSQRTKQTYRFANGRWNYVHPDDVEWLLSIRGFKRYQGEEKSKTPERKTPVLR